MKKSLKAALAVSLLLLLSFSTVNAENQSNTKETAAVSTYSIVSDPGGGEGH